MSDLTQLSRRTFLAATAALGAAALIGCGGGSSTAVDTSKMYRLSTKGQRASNAAKSNAANKLFATAADAENGRAHAGDNANVVPLDTNPNTWNALFLGGARRMVDLRKVAIA